MNPNPVQNSAESGQQQPPSNQLSSSGANTSLPVPIPVEQQPAGLTNAPMMTSAPQYPPQPIVRSMFAKPCFIISLLLLPLPWIQMLFLLRELLILRQFPPVFHIALPQRCLDNLLIHLNLLPLLPTCLPRVILKIPASTCPNSLSNLCSNTCPLQALMVNLQTPTCLLLVHIPLRDLCI